MSMSAAPDHSVLYDRDCGFCTRMLDRLMRFDRRGRLRALPIQSGEGQRLLADLDPALRLDSWHLIGPGGERHSAGAAAAPLARLLPLGAPFAFLFALLPGLTERAYRWVAGNRDLLGHFFSLLAVAVVIGGCGTTVQDDSELVVYLGAPLSGPDGADGRDLSAGAELALDDAGGEAAGASVRLEEVDESAAPRPDSIQAAVGEAARTATEDSTAIAYIGELESAATRVSTPITNASGLLQVAPGPTAEELLRKPGSNDPPADVQASGTRTLVALRQAGEGARPGSAEFADAFEAAYDRAPGPEAAYGYAAMSLILASIDGSPDALSRALVTSEALDATDRESVLGTYTIDAGGAAVFSSP